MVNDIKKALQTVEKEKGVVMLLMIIKEAQEIDKWTMLISSVWSDRVQYNTALTYWVAKLGGTLQSDTLRSIGRITFIKSNDIFVQQVINLVAVHGEPVHLQNTIIGKYRFDEAIIFKAIGTQNTVINSNKDPRFNAQINPKFNAHINPKFNAHINPKFNAHINPKFNAHINPKFNAHINPKFNVHINPKFNSHINPEFNSHINPRFNAHINPNFNSKFEGKVLYDLSLNRLAYMISIDEDMWLMFNTTNNFTNYAVKAEAGIYMLFDMTSEWVGYFINNSIGGYNYFSVTGQWLGFLV